MANNKQGHSVNFTAANGQELSFSIIDEAYRWYNISRVTYYRRLKRGMTPKQALEGEAFDYSNLPKLRPRTRRHPTNPAGWLQPGDIKECSKCKQPRNVLPDEVMKARNHPSNFLQDVEELKNTRRAQGRKLSLDNKARHMATYDGYHRDKYSPDGYRHICRNCANKKSRGYYHDNRDWCQQRHKEWYEQSMEDPVYAEQRREDKKRHQLQEQKRAELLEQYEMTDLAWAFTKNSENFAPREHDPGAPGEHAYNTADYQPKRAVTQAINAMCASDKKHWQYVYGETNMDPTIQDDE